MTVNSTQSSRVALESTLILHGVPRDSSRALALDLAAIVRSHGAEPALVAVIHGAPVVGVSDAELDLLLSAGDVPKTNTANLGVILHSKMHGATTVSTTMELAARAGVRVFATGGIGGVHRGYGNQWDVSADLAAFTRFPVGVVTSGVKSLLDVESTREALESLGVTVVGFRTDRFPAFYRRESAAKVDARFDDIEELARFCDCEMRRTGRGIVVCNPIPAEDELADSDWRTWSDQALREASQAGKAGRDVTPFVLGRLHAISGGKTLAANLALVKSNTAVAAALARAMPR